VPSNFTLNNLYMKTIIAPTDFSRMSINAVNYAADLSLAINAKLLVLHAVEIPVAATDEPLNTETSKEAALIKLKRKLLRRTHDKIKLEVKLVYGTIENELIKMCEYQKPFAIVMATHGDGIVERFFIESATVYLAKNLRYPVLVIPKNARFKPIEKITLASDMKSIYDLPFKKITGITSAFNAKLDVVHVNKTHSAELSEHSIQSSVLCHHLCQLKPEVHFVKDKNAEHGVTSFAEKNDTDLILIFPRKHGLFHRSDSRQFIFNSPFPVMTIQ
jgi:nucleotide-binding universal stress UspA family protein